MLCWWLLNMSGSLLQNTRAPPSYPAMLQPVYIRASEIAPAARYYSCQPIHTWQAHNRAPGPSIGGCPVFISSLFKLGHTGGADSSTGYCFSINSTLERCISELQIPVACLLFHHKNHHLDTIPVVPHNLSLLMEKDYSSKFRSPICE